MRHRLFWKDSPIGVPNGSDSYLPVLSQAVEEMYEAENQLFSA